jgi:phage-related tail protein
MIEDYWNKVQQQLEDLDECLDRVKDAVDTGDSWTARQEIQNTRNYADAVYSTCDDWNCDDDDDDDDTDEAEQTIEDWRDILDMLPDPKSLSAKDMKDLIDKVNEWKDSNGFSRNTFDNDHF